MCYKCQNIWNFCLLKSNPKCGSLKQILKSHFFLCFRFSHQGRRCFLISSPPTRRCRGCNRNLRTRWEPCMLYMFMSGPRAGWWVMFLSEFSRPVPRVSDVLAEEKKKQKIVKFGRNCEIWPNLWSLVKPYEFGMEGSEFITWINGKTQNFSRIAFWGCCSLNVFKNPSLGVFSKVFVIVFVFVFFAVSFCWSGNFYRTQVSLGSGLWVPVSLCQYVTTSGSFVKLCWCDSGLWWYQLNKIDDANIKLVSRI